MNKIILKNLLFIFSALMMFSCSTLLDDGRTSEGIIEYEVSYPKMEPTSILAELLPTKMTMKFKDDDFITDLSAGFGMFRMNVINHGKDREFLQLVKLINEKFMVNYDESSAFQSLQSFPEIKIEPTGKSKMIAEYECQEAVVTVFSDSIDVFNIYYTDKIRLEEPNWFTQFSGINGVLMEYQVERYNLCTRFKAIKVSPQEIDDEVFNVPDDYSTITETEMDEKMMNIFNSFSE